MARHVCLLAYIKSFLFLKCYFYLFLYGEKSMVLFFKKGLDVEKIDWAAPSVFPVFDVLGLYVTVFSSLHGLMQALSNTCISYPLKCHITHGVN